VHPYDRNARIHVAIRLQYHYIKRQICCFPANGLQQTKSEDASIQAKSKEGGLHYRCKKTGAYTCIKYLPKMLNRTLTATSKQTTYVFVSRFTTRDCGNAFGRVCLSACICLSVCPVYGSNFWKAWSTNFRFARRYIFRISMLCSYAKVIGSRSRSHDQSKQISK